MAGDFAQAGVVDASVYPSSRVARPVAVADTSTPRTLIVHVGLPKAASSYLHGSIFPQLMGGHYVMPGAANAKKAAYLFARNRFGVRRFSDAFQKSGAFWGRHGDSFLRQYKNLASFNGPRPRALLISDEAVTRVNHFGIRAMPPAFSAAQLCANLSGLRESAHRVGFERVRFLMMTRRQDKLLAASYVQLSRKIPYASQRDFERRVQRLLDRSPNELEHQFFGMDYGQLYDCFAETVGAENVSVMPIEMIGADFPGFIGEMRDVLDVQHAADGLSPTPANARSRRANRWGMRPLLLFKSRHGRLQFTLPARLTGRASEIELGESLARSILGHFSPENRRMAAATGRDLGAYGYYG
ncbi:hypothetical protein [Salinisphaera hydrothermalis]|uniref:Uncharacterized protein n=1 Tax=Salinisphaera hydrothermalis (strain C41B8) TaxID=1304275 RepID=A0A084II26_SALHC|nr:hypothetical protein [Salinisphaera hydrothermalis]KEZ76360.1 hypothetical protein C41B8_15500 [Salinisphaera hydrothermalis C41B8]